MRNMEPSDIAEKVVETALAAATGGVIPKRVRIPVMLWWTLFAQVEEQSGFETPSGKENAGFGCQLPSGDWVEVLPHVGSTFEAEPA